jgi:hypothetical protein
MPNLIWDNLSSLQIGRYAEYYAKMEFASYGFEVYTSEVDDHGVDFIIKYKNNSFFEVQVKALRENNTGNYMFIQKNKMDISNSYRIVCFIYFKSGQLPDVYLIPATVWKQPNNIFVERNYDKPDQKSKPEWGLMFSKKNRQFIEPYKIEQYIEALKTK